MTLSRMSALNLKKVRYIYFDLNQLFVSVVHTKSPSFTAMLLVLNTIFFLLTASMSEQSHATATNRWSDSDSPLPSDADSCTSWDSSEERGPTYTPQELGAIFLDFYQFLATLHYKAEDLKIPPPGGWTNLSTKLMENSKTWHAIEVLRHLPYFEGVLESYFHFKCKLIDYTLLTYDDDTTERDVYNEVWSNDGYKVDMAHCVCVAAGHETWGRELYLNTRDGELQEILIAGYDAESVDVKVYFGKLKEEYRTLKLIPCPGRITIEAGEVAERTEHITEEQVRNQWEQDRTDLDVQYIRQPYREYGWPDAFRRDEASRVINDMLASMNGRGHIWGGNGEWDDRGWT